MLAGTVVCTSAVQAAPAVGNATPAATGSASVPRLALPAGAAHQMGWQAGTSPSIAVAADGTSRIAFQASDGSLWTRSSSGAAGEVDGANGGHQVMPGTSPAIAALPNGTYETVYHSTDGLLDQVSPSGAVSSLGLLMAPGSSPSLAVAADGSWEVAFPASDGKLWTTTSAGAAGEVDAANGGHPLMPGASAAIGALPRGGYQIVYPSSDGLMDQVAPSGAVSTLALGMWAGTSPGIAVASDGSWEVAFQASDGKLWTTTSGGAAGEVDGANGGHLVMPGTSPAVAALHSGGYEVVYTSTDGLLDGVSPTGAVASLGLGMWSDSSPAIAASGAGFQEAVEANTSKLWTQESGGAAADTGLTMRLSFSITTASTPVGFVQAVTGHPGAIVHVAGDVNLDLSGLSGLGVASGVQLLGDRRFFPAGPRIFTTSFPRDLFTVGSSSTSADNVRISGLRLDGGESTDPFSAVDQPDADGIQVHSSRNVEIDHDEIYGWRGAAVAVDDELNRIDLTNADTVRIHDNYIHHNQHPTGEILGGGHGAGYGVGTFNGAYALIERNVFDFNRHDVTSDGRDGSGYLFYRNLLLPHGGDNTGDTNTQAIDVHGQGTCTTLGIPFGGDHNCGPAGEYYDAEYNTIEYTAGPAVHLRGIPSITMDVANNVFANSSADDALESNFPGTMTNVGIGNVFGHNAFDTTPTTNADFDGDGKPDRFLATGAGLWYQASSMPVAHGNDGNCYSIDPLHPCDPDGGPAVGRWVFLGQSTASASGVQLRDVNGDGRPDVVLTSGLIPLLTEPVEDNTSQPLNAGPQLPDVRGYTSADAVGKLRAAGYPVSQTCLNGNCTHPNSDFVLSQDQPPGIAVATRGANLHPPVLLGIERITND
ncbi:MAG: hypothetical protein HOV87_23985 [Catenulispora sp.]|nr:hypothetical protein [Catenulispora sp.]